MNSFKTEEWVTVKGFENYKISNYGRVYSEYTKKILIPTLDKNGYRIQTLFRNNKEHKLRSNRLVAIHFVDGYKDGLVVNHIDEDKTNDYFENLEWCTVKENRTHGSMRYHKMKKISMFDLDGVYIRSFCSLKEAGEFFGKGISNLSSHLNGRQKSWCGHVFKYE